MAAAGEGKARRRAQIGDLTQGSDKGSSLSLRGSLRRAAIDPGALKKLDTKKLEDVDKRRTYTRRINNQRWGESVSRMSQHHSAQDAGSSCG